PGRSLLVRLAVDSTSGRLGFAQAVRLYASSSIGRAADSKSAGCGFDSYLACSRISRLPRDLRHWALCVPIQARSHFADCLQSERDPPSPHLFTRARDAAVFETRIFGAFRRVEHEPSRRIVEVLAVPALDADDSGRRTAR